MATIMRDLHQAELSDVPTDGRLGDLDALRSEQVHELVLTGHGPGCHQFTDQPQALASCRVGTSRRPDASPFACCSGWCHLASIRSQDVFLCNPSVFGIGSRHLRLHIHDGTCARRGYARIIRCDAAAWLSDGDAQGPVGIGRGLSQGAPRTPPGIRPDPRGRDHEAKVAAFVIPEHCARACHPTATISRIQPDDADRRST